MNAPVDYDPSSAAWSLPLDKIDVSSPGLYASDAWRPYFERLRREAPVHYVQDSPYGPYWALTTYRDIVQVEANHKVFSSASELGGIQLEEQPRDMVRPSFIRMDPPRHDEQRKTVQPIVAPGNLANMEGLIRERTAGLLDSLPIGEEFNWVTKVSIELTTMMLATLFDFPFEERQKLTYWSDVAIANVNAPDSPVSSETERFAEMRKMAEAMSVLWNERAQQPPRFDLISMLAHGEATQNLTPAEFMGTLALLIVGGNDTTRNSMTGAVLALSRHPDQERKLRADPSLVSSMVPEIVRWQTPVIHMRRTATADVELHGHKIRKNDKVVMWYISGNRDETVIDRPEVFDVARKRPREHLSFGFGIHRCVGNRLAELQLKVLWEEILRRDLRIEVLGEPQYVYSNFIHGIRSLPVRIAA